MWSIKTKQLILKVAGICLNYHVCEMSMIEKVARYEFEQQEGRELKNTALKEFSEAVDSVLRALL